jgi:phosphoglycerol transferase MdoB-like AlkP superfamily enzyme
VRIDDLIAATDRSRSLRQEASGYQGNWRDVVLFVCVVLFAVIWWSASHSRTNWLPMFIVLILLAVVTAFYAARGFIMSLRKTMHQHHQHRHR